jgi:hypothetical protein
VLYNWIGQLLQQTRAIWYPKWPWTDAVGTVRSNRKGLLKDSMRKKLKKVVVVVVVVGLLLNKPDGSKMKR